jgi:hypothetical protein
MTKVGLKACTDSKEEAIEHTKYFLQVAGGGETEI